MLVALNILLIAAMAAVVVVIVLGLKSLGGNPQRAARLMQYRIAFQFAAIVLGVLIVALHVR